LTRSYQFCGQRIKTLQFSLQTLTTHSLNSVCYMAFNEFLQQTNQTVSEADLYKFMYLYWYLPLPRITCRFNQSTPFHNIGFVVSGDQYYPQCSYVSREWLGLSLPPILARLIDSIGPVAIHGRLIFPHFAPPTAANTTIGTNVPPQGAIGQSGQIVLLADGYFGENNLHTGGGTPPTSLGFQPGGVALTTAIVTTYYNNKQANAFLFFNKLAAYFMAQWDRLHKRYIAGASINSSFVHSHNPPCGSVNAMLTVVAVDPPAQEGFFSVPDVETTGTTWWNTFKFAEANTIGSTVCLQEDEVVEAAMFRHVAVNYTTSFTDDVAPYMLRLGSGCASSALIEAYSTQTFSTESSFSKAASMREAEFRPVKRDYGGVQVTVAEEQGCWFRDLLRTIGRQVFSSVRMAAPPAMGVVCNSFIPGTNRLCAAGTERLLDTLSSFAGVEADGHTAVKNPRAAAVTLAKEIDPKERPKRKKNLPVKKPVQKRKQQAKAKASKDMKLNLKPLVNALSNLQL